MVRRLAFISVLFLSACAQVGSPTGGEKDTQPPVVISATPELGATGVSTSEGGSITLEFDEYINVSQLSAQLLVSPPLKKPVEWWMKGKEVTFVWNEELEEGRTYVFQFGEAIVDIREGNAASNQLHAFSTGDKIDTLSLHGKVVDAFNSEELVGKKIFLYDSSISIDSIVAGALPQFVGNTQKNGEFTLRYLKEGEYRLLAIDDTDRNYQWTDGEALALHKDLVQISGADTLSQPLRMQKTADTEVKYFVSSSRDSIGLVEIEMSAELEDMSGLQSKGAEMYLEEQKLWMWGGSSDLIWEDADTLRFEDIKVEAAAEFSLTGPTGKIISGSEISLRANRPITAYEAGLFSVMKADSSSVQIDSMWVDENPFELILSAKFGRGETLILDILPEAITGWDKVPLSDTTQFKWSTFVSTDLAELNVNIDKDGWLELISANGTVVEKVALKSGAETVLYKNLTPGSYALRWLGDENLNGEWEGVSLKDWREPESAIVLPANIKVKADWSHTLDWE